MTNIQPVLCSTWQCFALHLDGGNPADDSEAQRQCSWCQLGFEGMFWDEQHSDLDLGAVGKTMLSPRETHQLRQGGRSSCNDLAVDSDIPGVGSKVLQDHAFNQLAYLACATAWLGCALLSLLTSEMLWK